MSLVENLRHEILGLSRLTPHYQDSPNFKAWIAAYLKELQALETALYDIYEVLDADNALSMGASDMLDRIGALVGEDRNGRTDSDFRTYIAVRILINKASGTAPELTGILAAVPEAWNSFVREYWPMSIIVEILDAVDPVTYDMDALLVLLKQAKTATVEVHLSYNPDGYFNSFRFDSGPGFDTGGAWGTAIA